MSVRHKSTLFALLSAGKAPAGIQCLALCTDCQEDVDRLVRVQWRSICTLKKRNELGMFSQKKERSEWLLLHLSGTQKTCIEERGTNLSSMSMKVVKHHQLRGTLEYQAGRMSLL